MFLLLLCLVVLSRASLPTSYTYQLSESSGGYNLWTTTTIRKVLKNDPSPTVVSSGVTFAAARGEWESFLIVVTAPADPVITFTGFSTFDTTQVARMYQGKYVSGLDGGIHPEELVPLASGGTLQREASGNTLLYGDVYVPRTATPGYHNSTITIGPVTVQVACYVFNFELPPVSVFKTQANIPINGVDYHNEAFDHHLTPKSVPWPSGAKYDITWTGSQLGACSVFDDESTHEACPFQLKCLADKYSKGQGWTENPRANGVGYGSWMLYQFVGNSNPRPNSFCGATLDGAQFGATTCNDLSCLDAPYNAAWGAWLTALQTWVEANGHQDKAYIYVANEPPDSQAKLMAVLSRVHKKYAPNIKIAVSEFPRPEIAEDPQFQPSGFDIWIGHVPDVDKPGNLAYATSRVAAGEELWLYPLPQDQVPYWNPSRSDYTGLHSRMIPWSCWSVHCTGFAYYLFSWVNSGTNAGGWFSPNRVPTLRAKLLRDGIDDYDYLYLANGGQHPVPGLNASVRGTVFSSAPTLTTWNSYDPDAQQHLRNDLGLFVEGTLQCAPTLVAECPATVMPRKAYFINFQQGGSDPYGPGTIESRYDSADGVRVYWDQIKFNGQPWEPLKRFGTMPNQDPVKGFMTGSSGSLKSGYASSGTSSQRSMIYDDNGRTAVFNWCAGNGWFKVTVSTGWHGRNYNDLAKVFVEGRSLFEGKVPTNQVIDLEIEVEISDCCVTVDFGQFNQYTFLSRLDIEPIVRDVPVQCSTKGAPLPTADTFPPNRSSDSVAIGVGVTFGILGAIGIAVVVLLVLRSKGMGPLTRFGSSPSSSASMTGNTAYEKF